MKRARLQPPRILLYASSMLLVVAGIFIYQFSQRPRVGIIVGHWQNDPGATCEDGLSEVDVNLGIAQQVAADLEKTGYQVDLLAEYDERLHGYRALVLVSLHADSCIPEKSGFKVARGTNSTISEVDDALVECLWTEYERATQLPRDPLHITPDMREYHVFQEIASTTPSAIVETGFLGGDRKLLTEQQETASQGISSGIRCFLETLSSNR